MRNSSMIAWVGLTLSALLLVVCQPAEVPEAETPEATEPAMSDEDAVRNLADEFSAAWNAADAASIAGLFSEDGDTVVGSDYRQGRQEIEDYYRESFSGMYSGTTLMVTPTSLRFLEPDVAVGDGTFEIAGMKDADGGEMPNIRGLYTNVLTKEAEQWLIKCSRPMIPVETPDTN